MGKVLIIGAGGVATVAAVKIAQNADVFTDIMIASRTKSKCDKIKEYIGNPDIKTAQVVTTVFTTRSALPSALFSASLLKDCSATSSATNSSSGAFSR